MSLRTLETSMLVEAQRVSGRHRLRHKDILAWACGEFTGERAPKPGVEIQYHCPSNGVWVLFYTDMEMLRREKAHKADLKAKKAAKA